MSNRTPCGTCALGNKGGACDEPYNALRAQICVLGGLPFACHEGFDWRSAHSSWRLVPVEHRKMCAGWQREIAALAQKGRFDEYRGIRRAIASIAIEEIEIMLHASQEGDEAKRRLARHKISRCLRLLTAPRIRFEKMKLDVFDRREAA